MKRMSIIGAILALAGIGGWCFFHESNVAIVRRIERLQSQRTNGLNMAWYEQNVLRHRLLTRGYLTKRIFDLPNTRMETIRSKELWKALITFRDTKCSSVANFGMGPADGSSAALYVTVTDLRTRIPEWKTMLFKWDSGSEETKDLQKEGPESVPTN